MSAGARAPSRTAALLLRRVDHGESDLVVQLYSEQLGRISALARGARRSQRRFGGALEPLHELTVALDAGRSSDLYQLREAALARPRGRLAQDLARMQAAATALGWLRKGTQGGHPEPVVWAITTALLDALDAEGEVACDALLARAGLALLSALGFALELERCVRCGTACAPGRPALADPGRGGLVCRACGGGPILLDAATRRRLLSGSLDGGDARLALSLVEGALAAHALA